VNADYPDHGEPPIRSALTFPPCICGQPECPDTKTIVADDDQPEQRRADDRSFSPTMQRLRPLVEKANRGVL
jgi:hypothetical protein